VAKQLTLAPQIPQRFYNWSHRAYKHKLIFTTYNSLNRIQESGIDVDTIYFDEAHNSVQRHFFPATEHFSATSDRCYFFTATPKHSATISKPGMNDVDVYGVNAFAKIATMTVGGYVLYYNMNQFPLFVAATTQQAEMWWFGLYADGKAGPVNISFDLIGDTGWVKRPGFELITYPKVKYQGWETRINNDRRGAFA
jgi:hypothetical protein